MVLMMSEVLEVVSMKHVSLSSHLNRWPQSAREVDSLLAAQRLPPQQKRPPKGPNALTAGRPTQALVHSSNASTTATGALSMPPMQKKTARHTGVTWPRYTLLRSKTSSSTHSTHQIGSGLELWTRTRTEDGNGLMGQVLTSPTGVLVNPTEGRGRTTQSWTVPLPLLVSGTISSTATTTITFASLPYEC